MWHRCLEVVHTHIHTRVRKCNTIEDGITSSKSVCCFLLNRPKVWMLMMMIIWWFLAKITSISFSLNSIAKYNLIRSSTAGKVDGERWHMSCDEVYSRVWFLYFSSFKVLFLLAGWIFYIPTGQQICKQTNNNRNNSNDENK